MLDAVETLDALAVAREAAADAVAILRDASGGRFRARAEAKQARDFVTETDHAAEAAIVERIQRAFPDHGILGEESGDRVGVVDAKWIVDPLDGTTNFMHGFPVYAVSIALVAGGEIQVGVVVDATRNEWFTARAGEGAWIDPGDAESARQLAVAPEPAPQRRLVATGFPFRQSHQIDRYLAAFRALFAHVGDMRRAGSAALDLAYVAAGRVDGFWEIGLSPWDIAAGELLVIEAGGAVSDWSGSDRHRKTGEILAGSRGVHAALLETLVEFAE